MIKKSLLLVFVVLISSCASIFNSQTVLLNIHSEVDSMRICLKNDTNSWHQLPTWIEVNRSRKDLPIITEHNKTRKEIEIDRKFSSIFIFANLLSPYGLGYVIDLFSNKAYKYPNYILLLNNNPNKEYSSLLIPEKGRLDLKFSLPYGVNYAGQSNFVRRNTYKFMGGGFGIDYYYKNNLSINSDIFLLRNIAENSYNYDLKFINRSTISTIDFQIGSIYKKFKYEYGIQFNQAIDEVEYYKDIYTKVETSEVVQSKFGLAFSAYYNLSNKINIGLNTYPSFIVFENSKLSGRFSNIVFLELMFKFETFSPRLKSKPKKFKNKFGF